MQNSRAKGGTQRHGGGNFIAATVELRLFGEVTAAGCVRDPDEVVVNKAFGVSAAAVSVFLSGTVYNHRQYRGYLVRLKAEGYAFGDSVFLPDRTTILRHWPLFASPLQR